MVTSIGHDVVTACASLRAGLTRATTLQVPPQLDRRTAEAVPVSGHPVVGITDGYQGVARYLRLGLPALEDLVAYTDQRPQAPDLQATGLFVCVSPARNDATGSFDELLAEELPGRLAEGANLATPESLRVVVSQGHAGVILAVRQACDFIRQGRLRNAIVLGLDSLVDAASVGFYAEQGRLRAPESPAGMMPGEAGAALFLESADDARAAGATEGLGIEHVSTQQTKHHFLAEKPSHGEALAQAMVESFHKTGPVATVFCDLNGEEARAVDWGHALVRLQAKLGYLPGHVVTPAEDLGDTGAASAAIAICAAARSYVHGYAVGERCAVVASSESGEVGAMTMQWHAGEAQRT
jgi:3-oxoacyl-[acyl-carrier-protein] synthase-1